MLRKAAPRDREGDGDDADLPRARPGAPGSIASRAVGGSGLEAAYTLPAKCMPSILAGEVCASDDPTGETVPTGSDRSEEDETIVNGRMRGKKELGAVGKSSKVASRKSQVASRKSQVARRKKPDSNPLRSELAPLVSTGDNHCATVVGVMV